MVKNIVIVGAGYAGVLTAKKLAKKLKKYDDISITIIDKNPFHTMLTELHEVAAGRVDEDSIKISLKKIFAGRKVRVELDTVTVIDTESKVVKGTVKDYPYDILVIAAGSKPAFYGVTGAEEYSYKLWSYDDAIILRDRIHEVFRTASREPDIEKKRALLSFYTIGAGFTGIEMAGELAEYVPILCEKYEIDRHLVSMYNVDILSRSMPNLPEKLSRKVERRLAKMGVTQLLNTGVTEIGKDYIVLKSGSEVTRHNAGTVIWAAGIESSEITCSVATKFPSPGRGRLATDEFLRIPHDTSVYVVGDNLCYIPKGEEKPVPQMVENCEQSSAVAAHNIVVAVTEKGEMKEYAPKFHGEMVCVGGRYGVANVGLPNFKFTLPSFLAMLSKHFINVIYFIQILGWNKIFSYLKHEFFTIRNNRSFLGGHFSNKSMTALLVPLRIWLGAVWLFEGVKKIVEGWFDAPKLKAFFNGADAWYDKILNGTTAVGDITSGASDITSGATNIISTGGAELVNLIGNVSADKAQMFSANVANLADAASGASDALSNTVSKVGEVLVNFDFFGWFRALFVSGTELSRASLSDLAVKLDIPFVDWIVNSFVLSSDGMQMFMQIFIVLAEILIGLALIGGLFTTPAASFSLVLQFMFLTTTGLYLSNVWMIFAGIAMLFGAGRVLGLDYYVMPALKRGWRKIPFVRKLYIYHD